MTDAEKLEKLLDLLSRHTNVHIDEKQKVKRISISSNCYDSADEHFGTEIANELGRRNLMRHVRQLKGRTDDAQKRYDSFVKARGLSS